MIDHVQSESNPHGEAEELLPWYANGQLEPDERALVEQHLSSCAHCRRQLAFERGLIVEMGTMTPEVDSGWARLRRKIEPRPSRTHIAARQVAAIWHALIRPPVAALAFAQLAILVVAGTVLLSLMRPSYHALSSAPPPRTANVIAMFTPETRQSDLTRLLRSTGASLAGGPTSTDAYLLRVPAASRPQALSRLRADRHVIMAEPIDGQH